ncbi:MAG TPA: VOC family protein [Candidatus Baltobacteraceae bacterium]|nr:VOC family protein [Candidatus Baltobacteraceae bacterium]
MASATHTTLVNGMDAVYYIAKDFDRARKFYETGLNLRPTVEIIGEGGGSFVEYDLPDGTTFGIATLNDSPWHMNGSIEFGVPDVDAAVKSAVAAGATLNDDLELPSCRMAWLQDTEGNSFCLHKRK